MKKFKKLAALLLAAAMVVGMMVSASAAGETESADNSNENSSSSATATFNDGTITIHNSAKGVTYHVYKLFKATVSEYKVDGKNYSILYDLLDGQTAIPTGLETYFTVSTTDGHVYVTDAGKDPNDSSALSSNAIAALKTWAASATQVKQGTGTGTDLVIDSLDAGFYVLTATTENNKTTSSTETDNGTSTTYNSYDAIIVTSINPYAEVYEKNATKPSKTDGKEFKALVDATGDTNVEVGDMVQFEISFATVNYTGSGENAKVVKSYTISDTGTNLKIDTTKNFVVTVAGVTAPLTAGTDYTITPATTDNNTVTVTIKWVDDNNVPLYNEGAEVSITYYAEVLSTAVSNTTTTANTVKNSATIKYNDGEVKDLGEKEIPLTTQNFELKKVNAQNQALTGATFTLQKLNKTTNQYEDVNVVADSNGYHIADSTETSYADAITAGDVYIKGLDADETYQLVELTAPTGYNKLGTAIPVVATATNQEQVSGAFENGYYTAPTATTGTSNVFQNQIVVNVKGSTLPTTGGMGTTIFYVAGGILVVAALVVLITKKRMDAQN